MSIEELEQHLANQKAFDRFKKYIDTRCKLWVKYPLVSYHINMKKREIIIQGETTPTARKKKTVDVVTIPLSVFFETVSRKKIKNIAYMIKAIDKGIA